MRISNFQFPISKINVFTFVILSVLVITPLSAKAFFFNELFDELEDWLSGESASTQIINEVNVSTNTGGNVAKEGEIKEGEAKSQIYVKNIINGKEIEPIDIETEAQEVKVKSEINVENEVAQVQREIEIDSEKEVENYQVELPAESPSDNQAARENEGVFNNLQNWWQNFINNLKSIINNIFNIF